MAIKMQAAIITDYEEGMRVLDDEPSIAFDLETTGLSPFKDRIAVIALYGPLSNTSVIWHNPGKEPYPEKVIEWLSSKTPSGQRRELVTHNGACFDIEYMWVAGMDIWGVDWWDTLISEQVSLSSGRKGISVSLGKTFERRLGRSLKKKIDHRSWQNSFLTEDQLEYVTGDIKYLHEVKAEHLKKCSDSRARALKVEMKLLPVVVRMTCRGMPIDMDELKRYLDSQVLAAEKAMVGLVEALGTINFNSPIQIKKSFADKGFILVNTKAETISDLAQEHFGTELGNVFELMKVYRHANQRIKMFSSEWVDKYVSYSPEFKCYLVHPRFRALGTETGRFSANEPNLQQIPKDMRAVFGNVPGYSIVTCDYSAIEVRAAASISGDEVLIAALKKQDIHTYVASQIFSKPEEEVTKHERSLAKAATFTLLFGGGAKTLQSYAKMYGAQLTLPEAKQIVQTFFETFDGLNRMRREAYLTAQAGGARAFELPTGIRRVLAGDQLTPQRILNTMVQSLAAAFMKFALISTLRVPYKNGLTLADLISATVHDEIVLFVPEEDAEWAAKALKETMIEAAYRVMQHRDVPIEAESSIGITWAG